jgi:hypothetical protein
MNLPWNKTIPRQMAIDDFSEKGIRCHYCGQYKEVLIGILFAEGIDSICEECEKHYTLADWFRPPPQKEFAKRIQKRRNQIKEGEKLVARDLC